MQEKNNPVSLLPHPGTPATMVRAIEVHALFRADSSLALSYRLWGDMARLLVPQAQSPEHRDLLWEHTCFEAFVGVHGQTAYREFNFSPSGHWASYAFSDYRQRDPSLDPEDAPQIATRRFAGRLELEAIIPPGALPSGITSLQIGLAAVVEAADTLDGRHSYWALHHPQARPDFHRRDAFTLILSR